MKRDDHVSLPLLVRARRRDVRRLARWLEVSTEGGRFGVAYRVAAEIGMLQVEDAAAADEELRDRARETLRGVGRSIDMTHPDYCPECDGACRCERRAGPALGGDDRAA